MNKKLKVVAIGTVLASALALAYGLGRARASGAPTTTPLWYAGQLTDATGTAVADGSHTFALKLYRQSNSAVLCDTTGSAQTVTTSRGYFRVLVDACVATNVHTDSDTTLELFIDGTSMGTPQKVGAVPYALEATNANTAATAMAAGGALLTEINSIESKLAIVTYTFDQAGAFGKASEVPRRFVGTPVTITTTSTQRLTAVLTVELSSVGATGGGNAVAAVPCYRANGTTNLQTLFRSTGNGINFTGASIASNTGAGSIVPGAGTWDVGACTYNFSNGGPVPQVDVIGVSGFVQVTN